MITITISEPVAEAVLEILKAKRNNYTSYSKLKVVAAMNVAIEELEKELADDVQEYNREASERYGDEV